MNTIAIAVSGNLHSLLIGFLVLCLVILCMAGLVWFIESYINKAPFPPPVRMAIAVVVLIIVVIWLLNLSGCAYAGTPQGQAVISSSETIAKAAVEAAATTYGGPVAGQLAGAGLDALATVLQGYIGKTVPPAVVNASPGITSVAKAISPKVSTSRPISQSDVNILYKAASIATKQ